jgi:hypothetical protein
MLLALVLTIFFLYIPSYMRHRRDPDHPHTTYLKFQVFSPSKDHIAQVTPVRVRKYPLMLALALLEHSYPF